MGSEYSEFEGIHGKRTKTASLKCSVDDHYIVGLKHAHLKRKIIYENPSTTDLMEIDFLTSKHIYSHFCTDFICKINGNPAEIGSIHTQDYSKAILINEQSKKLNPQEKLEIEIECEWKNFINFLNDCYINFSFKQIVSYRLTIHDINIAEYINIILIDEVSKNESDQEIDIAKSNVNFFSKMEKYIIPDKGISIRLLILNTPKELPVLNSIFKDQSEIFKDYVIIFIQHLLSDFVHLVKKIEQNGASKENIFICGIPYSTKDTTTEYLKLSGFPNIFSPQEYPFEKYVIEMLEKAITLAKSKNKKIIVIEDGGYIFPLLYNSNEFEKELFALIVEQTTNGISRDKEIIETKKLKEHIPIINVAESTIKTSIESKLIGKTVVNNIEQLLAKEFKGLEGKIIGLVGYGHTGQYIGESLVNRGATVKIYEEKIDRKLEAEKAGKGFQLSDTIIDTVKDSHIVIEATGNNIPWANMNVISKFKNAAYFISSSSKRLGINYKDLLEFTQNTPINLPGIGKRYYLNNQNYITLLADGYPVNFFIGESVPDYQIQFIICLLFGVALLGIQNKDLLSREIIDVNLKDGGNIFNKLQEDIRADYYYSMR